MGRKGWKKVVYLTSLLWICHVFVPLFCLGLFFCWSLINDHILTNGILCAGTSLCLSYQSCVTLLHMPSQESCSSGSTHLVRIVDLMFSSSLCRWSWPLFLLLLLYILRWTAVFYRHQLFRFTVLMFVTRVSLANHMTMCAMDLTNPRQWTQVHSSSECSLQFSRFYTPPSEPALPPHFSHHRLPPDQVLHQPLRYAWALGFSVLWICSNSELDSDFSFFLFAGNVICRCEGFIVRGPRGREEEEWWSRGTTCELLILLLPYHLCACKHVRCNASLGMDWLIRECDSDRCGMDLGLGQDMHRLGHSRTLHMDTHCTAHPSWSRVLLNTVDGKTYIVRSVECYVYVYVVT